MIKIYNTMTRKVEEFIPVKENEVSMYVCGPTVYNYIHIGNARPAIVFDTVRRYFEYRGYKVKYVQNFTDVDDKIIKRANEEGVTSKEIARKYIEAYFEDTKKVNLKEEGMIRPRATEYIDEMQEIIKKLISEGYAYEAEGDVYFEVEKNKEGYGCLSHQDIGNLKAGARIEVNDIKKSPLDFALWKKAKEGEPSWDSPWGKGRPGWHIECSAMSSKLLGDVFDIHGGGQDLIFPHHENEIAQSRCSSHQEYARYWMHNGYINVNGEKMSKSLGNFFLLREVLEHFEGRVIRFFVLGAHYRKPIDFSNNELEQAKSGLERIDNAVERLREKIKSGAIDGGDNLEGLKSFVEETEKKFIEAMDDDFNTAQGIGAIFELVKEINKYVDIEKVSQEGIKNLELAEKYIENIMEEVLGVTLKTQENIGNLTTDLVEFLLEIRRKARAEKNWALSDEIRDRLGEMGIKIKDGKDKTTWSL
ncbi:MAG: cysteine--tRNA ligase [Fusobacterium perfoetens]|uniref:cysteine--tRNA ligase n=1 Tax=Fusobacterium perfoetens TaxID=852 RepID=UPI0023F188FD|nr:cysteine--tRNA ligase [Fusobacterium perfoetens]MCI6151523.1 cysteine--tRNA ligase [Fusobacterium perfoetens]MDY3236728.1 cysteine--tRNA ligase [Fusobacterium perfoetens]